MIPTLALVAFLSATLIAAATLGKIENGAPRYVKKNHDAWAGKGRIVGVAKHAPSFTVTILDAEKKVVAKTKAEGTSDGKRAYEAWLPPGVYTLLVQAEGYSPHDVHHLEVRKGFDLRIDLEFTAAAAD
jgi:hypothetical protein